MTQSKRRFFIALLPPAEIQQIANKIKQHFAEVYNSCAAQKSPPHITLQPPFEWKLEDLTFLEQKLGEFAIAQSPISMTLDGFSAFKPRVIFINVLKTPELLAIQKALMDELETSLRIVHEVSKNRPFSPHLTVGFRDLTKANFYKAWDEFKEQQLRFEFLVSQLTLLIHNGQRWEIHQEFLLGKKE
ncbi:MAG: 2'-5' RNA ligase family protein [Hydrococcus sp. Prado102]|jgi:2'-5' RNA ligase|nr:2'-5' RNA ligase family protein [Hydrococcus sp. Prado102]